ncbi:MAG: RNA polymerase sigma factor [Bacteroidales bacterium]|nr:RNA polymerase sigma factor [Bacteroidales bacterium]
MSLPLNNPNRKPEVEQTDISRDIIDRSKKGDRQAQYQLYKMYARAMFNICYRMMNDKSEAEDMLQESFSEAFRRLDSFRHESTFGAWLKMIVINKCINEIKRKKAQLEFFDDMSPFEEEEELQDEQEMGLSPDKIKKAMEGIPKGSRMIFSLYLLEGYDHQEISEILNISESNSKTQYMRAKQRIKEILKTQVL